MLSNQFAGQRGIGLVEVLVAVVIVAIGLLALASFEGELLKSSGETKAKSEAISLAEQKIEEFRTSMERENALNTGYEDNPSLVDNNIDPSIGTTYQDPDNPIAGTNATFTRTWTVNNVAPFLTGGVTRKEIEVNVLWGPASDQQEVATVSEIAWIDPAKSILAASDDSAGTAAVPSPRQNASEDVASENVFNVPDSEIDVGTPGSSQIITLQTVESVEVDEFGDPVNQQPNVNLTQIAPGSYYYSTDDDSYFFVDSGVIAVFLCDPTQLNCKYIQNHFGGVSHRIRGKVYSKTGTLSNIGVAWTSSDVNACYVSEVYQETKNNTLIDVIDYECVFAGNCDEVATHDGIGTGNGCSVNVTDEQIAERNVGPGGEFGDVGLLGLDSQGNGQEKVCFLEDTSNYTIVNNVLTHDPSGTPSPEDYYLPVTKRLYVSRRISSSGGDNRQSSEGINRSYSNHNFMVVERGSTSASYQNCYKSLFTVSSSGSTQFYGFNLDSDVSKRISLAMREVVRVMNSTNTVASEQTYAGGTGPSKTILENITSDKNDLRIYISEAGTCYIKSDMTKYACAVDSDMTSTQIKAGSSSKPSNASQYATCNKTLGVGTCAWWNDSDF